MLVGIYYYKKSHCKLYSWISFCFCSDSSTAHFAWAIEFDCHLFHTTLHRFLYPIPQNCKENVSLRNNTNIGMQLAERLALWLISGSVYWCVFDCQDYIPQYPDVSTRGCIFYSNTVSSYTLGMGNMLYCLITIHLRDSHGYLTGKHKCRQFQKHDHPKISRPASFFYTNSQTSIMGGMGIQPTHGNNENLPLGCQSFTFRAATIRSSCYKGTGRHFVTRGKILFVRLPNS
jgi:hypothetical protein